MDKPTNPWEFNSANAQDAKNKARIVQILNILERAEKAVRSGRTDWRRRRWLYKRKRRSKSRVLR